MECCRRRVGGHKISSDAAVAAVGAEYYWVRKKENMWIYWGMRVNNINVFEAEDWKSNFCAMLQSNSKLDKAVDKVVWENKFVSLCATNKLK